MALADTTRQQAAAAAADLARAQSTAVIKANLELRAAAAELGAVYLQLVKQGNGALEWWAVPKREGILNNRLLLALAATYGLAYGSIMDRYRDAYDAVKPKLQNAIINAAHATLTKQANDLVALGGRLEAAGVPDALHRFAVNLGTRAGGYWYTDADQAPAVKKYGKPEGYPPIASSFSGRKAAFDAMTEGERSKRFESALRQTPDTAYEGQTRQLIRILHAHPSFMPIMTAYAVSAVDGIRYVRQLITEARTATGEFIVDLLANPDHVWRYPSLIVLGVQRLDLLGVPGFLAYSVALGRVFDPRTAETVLGVLQLVVCLVGVVLSGPLAAAAVGIVDLAVTLKAGELAYLHEREQDMAATGSVFRGGGRLADPSDGKQTGMAGAAAFLSVAALVSAGIGVLNQINPLNRTVKAAEVAPKRTGPYPELSEAELEAQLDRSTNRPHVDERAINREIPPPKTASPESDISPEMMEEAAENVKRAKRGPGKPRTLTPAELEAPRGVGNTGASPPFDPLDYNVVPDEALMRPTQPAPDVAGPGRPRMLDPQGLENAAVPKRGPELRDLPRAGEKGRGAKGPIVSREDQLYGIDLEWDDLMRRSTPTQAIREWAKRMLKPGDPDPLIPTVKVRSVQADHIVAVELIRRFPGFAQLSRAAQLEVLNMPENFMAISGVVNRRRGSVPYALWDGWGRKNRIPAPILAAMRVREKDLALLIQNRINELLAAQNAGRGISRVAIPIESPDLIRLWEQMVAEQGRDDDQSPDPEDL